MSTIETYYLIDFENVHEDGLSGSENLGRHDHVFLFSTKNTPKISIEKLNSFNNTDPAFHEIPAGNQSLDMHLVSYLGYLIGKNTSNCKYIIVSKDTDYDNIISFWKRQNNTNIIRKTQIAVPQQRNSASSVNSSAKKSKATVDVNMKSQLNTAIQRAVSNDGYSQATIGETASIVVKHYGEDDFANNVHNDLRSICHNYTDVYKLVKPIMTKYSSAPNKSNNATTQLNSQIQKALSHAGYPNDIISHTASIVCKHCNKTNSKQTIYREIIAKYGQIKGLKIYNSIKGKL